METANGICLVLTTLSTDQQAEAFARSVVEARLAACVTRIPNAISLYFWQSDTPTEDSEVLLLIKTHRDKLPALESHFVEHHPYVVPEFLVFEAAGVSKSYQNWLIKELNPGQ